MKLLIQPIKSLPIDKFFLIFNLAEYFKDKEDPTVSEMALYLSDWTGVPREELMKHLAVDLHTAFIACMEQINEYKPKAPKQKIGKYTFREPSKQSFGWWHHFEVLKDNPVQQLGLMYIEEGQEYNMTDGNSNTLNPAHKRVDDLANQITLVDFLDIYGFFLHRSKLFKEMSLG